jgi:hypothetical protein
MTTSTTASAETNDVVAGFRIIVRGTNSKNQRVRRVRVMHGTEADVTDGAGEVAKQVIEAENLQNATFNVFPPSGIRLDGNLSKGHGVVDGFVTKLKEKAAA